MPNDHETTDEHLALRVQQGDKQSFGFLVERYQQKLTRYGRRFFSSGEDIQDIVQDVFLSAYQNIRSFDTSQRFSPWIYRIAHNAFINALKKQKRNRFISLDLDFDTFFAHPVYENPDDMIREQQDMRKMIDQSL